MKKLKEKYGLDLDDFSTHSSYAVLREDVYDRGCSNIFATKSIEELGYSYIQMWNYHTDGTFFTDCEDWTVILV